MANKNKKGTISSGKFWSRVLCIILAALMVGSVAFLGIQLIVEGIREAKKDEKKDASAISVTLEESYPEEELFSSCI